MSTREYFYQPVEKRTPLPVRRVTPEHDQRTVTYENQSCHKRPSIAPHTDSIRTKTVHATTQTNSTGRPAPSPQRHPSPTPPEVHESSQDQYRLTRVEDEHPLPPHFVQAGDSSVYYKDPRQGPSESNTRGLHQGALSTKPVEPQQRKAVMPEDAYSRIDGHAHRSVQTDPLPPRRPFEMQEGRPTGPRLQQSQPATDPRLQQQDRRGDQSRQQPTPSSIRYEDTQILIDEPDTYPPLHTSGRELDSEQKSPRGLSDESRGKPSSGMRGDPRSYYNEHLKRNTAKAKHIDDLHSAKRSHFRKQDQVIQSLQEEKEALRKLLHKMINENLRKDSARNSQASPERSSSKGGRDRSFDSQKRSPAATKKLGRDTLPTKKKDTKGGTRSDSTSRDGRQGVRPPKSRTRQEAEKPSRYGSSRKESDSSSKAKKPAAKSRPLQPRNTNKRESQSPAKEYSPRKFPFDIAKGGRRTEYDVMEPFLDRYGGRLPPASQQEPKYSATKNPFLKYPPPRLRRSSESPDENRYNAKEVAAKAYRPTEKDRKNCTYCADHDNYLDHSPNDDSRPARHHSPEGGDSSNRGAITFAPQDEYYFEGKVYISP